VPPRGNQARNAERLKGNGRGSLQLTAKQVAAAELT